MQNDISKQPWAHWMEECLQLLNDEEVNNIAIVAINRNGETSSGYWHCNSHIKTMIASIIMQDARIASLSETFQNWIDILREQLSDEDEEDETE